jgi:hypothetical protein
MAGLCWWDRAGNFRSGVTLPLLSASNKVRKTVTAGAAWALLPAGRFRAAGKRAGVPAPHEQGCKQLQFPVGHHTDVLNMIC